jgi:hypothetical protein
MSNFLDEFLRTVALAANPIAPENRNYARLVSAPWIARGQMYRLVVPMAGPPSLRVRQWLEAAGLAAAAETQRTPPRPLILMHPADIAALVTVWVSPASPIALARHRSVHQIYQEIADTAEELFARREAQEGV